MQYKMYLKEGLKKKKKQFKTWPKIPLKFLIIMLKIILK